MAFKDELFARIGGQESGENDPYKLIKSGDSEYQQGNVGKASELYKKALEVGKANAEKLEGLKQYRSSAEAYYLSSLALLRLGKDEEAKAIYSNVGTQLLEAANMYLRTYNEFVSGALCASLGGLIYVLQGDLAKAKSIYEEYLAVVNEKEQAGQLSMGKDKVIQIIWVLGYVIKALQDVNYEALHQAQNIISSQIRPVLGSHKLAGIEPLLTQTEQHVQEYFQSQIKLPNIKVDSVLPKEMVVNQIFTIEISLTNSGEGDATDIQVEFTPDEELEILEGSLNYHIPSLSPGSDHKITFQIRYQSGTPEDTLKKFSGIAKYNDMLSNSHTAYIGPYELDITAETKKEKYDKRLAILMENSDAISQTELLEGLPSDLKEIAAKLEKSIADKIREEIESESYAGLDFALSYLEAQRSVLKDWLVDGQEARSFAETLQNLRESYAEEKVQAVIEAKEEEMNERISALQENHKKEIAAELEKQANNLKALHENEIKSIQNEYEQKLEDQKSTLERTMNAKINDAVESLQEKHHAEISKFKDEQEAVMRDVRETLNKDHEQELVARLEEEKEKFEEKLKEKEHEFEEAKRMLEEAKREEISTVKERLITEYEQKISDLKDEYERKLQGV